MHRLSCLYGPAGTSSPESFRANVESTADEDWSKADQDARQIIKAELGHGPDRDDVMAQYLGAKC